jgi:hypothetical protein
VQQRQCGAVAIGADLADQHAPAIFEIDEVGGWEVGDDERSQRCSTFLTCTVIEPFGAS